MQIIFEGRKAAVNGAMIATLPKAYFFRVNLHQGPTRANLAPMTELFRVSIIPAQ